MSPTVTRPASCRDRVRDATWSALWPIHLSRIRRVLQWVRANKVFR